MGPEGEDFAGADGVCVVEIDWLLPSAGGGGSFGVSDWEVGNCGGKGWGEVSKERVTKIY